jgi:hypothetical protein
MFPSLRMAVRVRRSSSVIGRPVGVPVLSSTPTTNTPGFPVPGRSLAKAQMASSILDLSDRLAFRSTRWVSRFRARARSSSGASIANKCLRNGQHATLTNRPVQGQGIRGLGQEPSFAGAGMPAGKRAPTGAPSKASLPRGTRASPVARAGVHLRDGWPSHPTHPIFNPPAPRPRHAGNVRNGPHWAMRSPAPQAAPRPCGPCAGGGTER